MPLIWHACPLARCCEVTLSGEGGLGWFQAVILGLVEGVTEFLPISSTGHLIVTNALFGVSDPAFEVAIQAGAITAILALYWRDLADAVRSIRSPRSAERPRVNLLWLIVIAALPAAFVGVLLEEQIEALLFNPVTVGVVLMLGGVAFLLVERWLATRQRSTEGREVGITEMTAGQALLIGAWQCLALVPGTSRSGATIIGGLLTGMSRKAAAEFSFLVGLPVLYGACLLKVVGDYERLTGPMLPSLLLSSAVAFVSAYVVVRAFVRYLQRNTFRVFAYYRLIAGAGILVMYYAGPLVSDG